MKRQDKRFTGRDALLWIVLFFGAVALANGIMIWFALTSGAANRVAFMERPVAVASAGTEARSWPI